MKTKPILIVAGILLVITCVFLFVRSRNLIKPDKNEIVQFLNWIDINLVDGHTDSVKSCFETKQRSKVVNRLINILSNKNPDDGKENKLFKLALDVNNAQIKVINTDLAEAKIPVLLSQEKLGDKNTSITFRIHKISLHVYKIVQINAIQFMTDYLAYSSFIKSKTLTDKDLYSDITLKAFETANQLKSKYDSVVWFAHMDNKTFFYVVKGKWDMRKDIYEKYIYSKYTNRFKDSVIEPYKMGLVGPDLKEIIPPEYDLIYNIGGTFPGLIEVEKDNKKGFYDLDGKNIVPVAYDQIFPIEDENNMAILKIGNDFFYLKNDMSISEKTDLKIGDFFTKIIKLKDSFNLNTKTLSGITEYNSREENGALYIPPSYLVDLGMVDKVGNFENPLRKNVDEEVHINYKVDVSDKSREDANWFEAIFYSIRDHFIGGRGEFYDKKNLVIIDKRNNRILTQDIRTDYGEEEEGGSFDGVCNINNIRAINDTLFEVKAGAEFFADLYDTTKVVTGGSYYHYLIIRNNKLEELPDNRNFGFTKYVKMDDSYLNGCYNMLVGSGQFDQRETKTINRITPEMLRYMKNEIYADYGYQFKDKRWSEVFSQMPAYEFDSNTNKPKEGKASVDDSLTAIDKYNINWINQKLKEQPSTTLAAK
jgi:hypothetical protein